MEDLAISKNLIFSNFDVVENKNNKDWQDKNNSREHLCSKNTKFQNGPTCPISSEGKSSQGSYWDRNNSTTYGND